MNPRSTVFLIYHLIPIFVASWLLAGWTPVANAQTRDLYRITEGVSDSHVEYHLTNIPKGKEVVLANLQGPGVVTYFYFTDEDKGALYPGLVLKVFWDDEKEPSINVPLGDFFGAFNSKAIDYQSLVMQINHYSY
ncbi:MAG: DUF2961 domain-containing protein, partial [Pyrinomonadaceae bacterium]|nr:DUF2961 domain-containing protein [Pyrinomonadaceae bacterium]